jgi:hypothetical protein
MIIKTGTDKIGKVTSCQYETPHVGAKFFNVLYAGRAQLQRMANPVRFTWLPVWVILQDQVVLLHIYLCYV